MKISRVGSTPKQTAYAKRIWAGQGVSKKQIALDVGYSRFSANSIKSKIENKRGFNNAMSALAIESNSLALSAMHEFKARGFRDFSNKDLVGALNAIGSAWTRFNQTPKQSDDTKLSRNKLRTVILQRVENQTVQAGADVKELPPVENIEEAVDEAEAMEDNPNDF